MARFMAALAMAYMFDGRPVTELCGLINVHTMYRMDEFALIGTSSESTSRTFMLPQFVLDFFNSIFVLNFTLVSETVIARFVAMLRNPSSTIKACAIFALVQFTALGSRHAPHHVALLRDAGAPRVLRVAAAAATAPLDAKVFARIVLRNLE
ncbi:hypothetical protein RHSIM_Rhsim07G0035100 [Rhododendron simsii]|uniref:Uncharacterized protein n=1 Tax=Rhododendron simsii TaxID=118357 RepID=A0A834GPW3_RHOSS|nr:hypothetical protein RHSIM_Rhsim07G0035100 [Rhododendron simsii]